jgi:Protein of unknown function (DUF4232)
VTRRNAAAALALAGCVVLAGCGKVTGRSTAAASGADTRVPTVDSPAPSSASAPTSAAATTAATASVTPTAAPTSAKPTTTQRPTPAVPTCLLPALHVHVLRGGAVPGSEIALIIVTNNGAATCTLAGFPTVSLLLNGRQLGQPSSPSNAPVHPVTLKSGGQANSQITDHSSCQAAVSDTVRVSLPGVAGGAVDQALQMRGCTLVVDPVSPA